ncbi:hypothetical protein [Sphingomonas koreensis]|uniref:hypothetical protein n=1 Tax=Sphingomonas koreensis TaxID=93064 RepID=UPI000F7DDA1F|nr:hypothetical protein [Sphingomonas koreensis]RSX14115.1 hypothetical protein CA227_02985 [Sphingomonas koreensis]
MSDTENDKPKLGMRQPLGLKRTCNLPVYSVQCGTIGWRRSHVGWAVWVSSRSTYRMIAGRHVTATARAAVRWR